MESTVPLKSSLVPQKGKKNRFLLSARIFKNRKIQKYYGKFRNLGITNQIFLVFILLLGVFVTVLIFLKLNQLSLLLKNQVDKNYYSSVVIEKLNKQRELKSNVDSINTIKTQKNLNRNLVLASIYTKEMIKKGLLNKESIYDFSNLDLDNSKNIYSKISPSFIMTSSLSDIMNPQGVSSSLKNIIPMMYNNIPLFYQNFKLNKISLQNFFLIGHKISKCDSGDVYFKFPLEKLSFRMGGEEKNDEYYDRVMDPLTECSDNGDKENNWFYLYEKDFISNPSKKYSNSYSRTLAISKQDYNKETKEYIFHLTSMKFEDDYVISLVQKVLKEDITNNFFTYDNDYNDILSISNKKIGFQKYIEKNSLYSKEYQIDDGNTRINNMPDFLEKFISYTMTSKEQDKSNDIKGFYLPYSDFSDFSNKYNINYYFSDDILIYDFIKFINTFFDQQNLKTPSCPVKNLTEYYNRVSDLYNCRIDYCFYNKCKQSKALFKDTFDPWEYSYLPNCYCLPLFCVDNENKDTIPEDFLDIYLFRNGTDDFISSGINFKGDYEYFNPKEKSLKCRVSLNRKNSNNKPSYYHTKVNYLLKESYSDISELMIHFYDDSRINSTIINNFSFLVNKFMWEVYLLYSLGVIILLVVIIVILWIKVRNLTKRVLGIKKILPRIIEYSSQKNKEKAKKEEELSSNPSSSKALIRVSANSNYNSNDLSEVQRESSAHGLSLFKEKYGNLIDDDPLIQKNENEEIIDKEKNTELFYKSFGMIKNKDTGKFEPEINDELQDLNNIIYNHIKEFNLSFSVNHKIFGNKKVTRDMLNMLKAKHNDSRVELSMNIFNELLSCEGFVDFSKVRPNFYYKDKVEHSLISKFDDMKFKIEGANFISEVTDGDKIKNAIDYYVDMIQKTLVTELEK